MTEKVAIVDASTLNNLYYGGGASAWDKLAEHYDRVIIPDTINQEMTTKPGLYAKDDDFIKWRDNNSKIEIHNTNVDKDARLEIESLEQTKILTKNERKKITDDLGEKAMGEVADKAIDKGTYPDLISDEKDFFGKANASDQVKTITPIKTPDIMNDMLDKNTITPVEYEGWKGKIISIHNPQFHENDFRDLSKPYDKTIERMDAAREIGELVPKAKAEADQAVDFAQTAALKDSSPEAAAKVARAEKEKDWVDREGTIPVLAGKLAEVEGETITVRVEPEATLIGRLQALSNGIDAEVVRQQQQEQARVAEPVRSVPEVTQPTPVAERSGPEAERER